MRPKLIILLFACLAVAGCKTTSTTQPQANSSQASETSVASPSPAVQPSTPLAPAEPAAAKAKLDACPLLTGKEIEAIQGENVKETKLSGQSAGAFSISQCFFTLPTFNNSISLLVAQKGDGAGARDPKDFWRSTFHDDKARENVKEREKEKGEKEESAPPQKVSGIDDEAFWMGNKIAGALYVLKGNAYVRVSIGGPTNEASKRRSKALAQKALARL